MEHVEYTYTVGMDDDEVAATLREADVGVLSLADGGRAYGIPIHFHYDGESLYLRLTEEDHSQKAGYVDATEQASFLVYDAGDDLSDSFSVVATGTLRRLTGEERDAFDDATINEDFGPVRVFGEAIDDVDVRIYELVADSITGRRTPDAGD